MTFSKNVFWYVDCKLPFYQIYYVQMSAGVKVDISCKKLHTRKYFQEKSLDRIYNVIYGPHLSRSILKESFQPILCHESINSMHKSIITSCTCAYVSDFKQTCAKMFQLNVWSEYQNLFEKFEAILKINPLPFSPSSFVFAFQKLSSFTQAPSLRTLFWESPIQNELL